MSLVRVFLPQSESEVLVATAMLEAHGITAFVQNRGIGSLLPGVQINSYNTQSIWVAEENVADALELLARFNTPPREAVVPLRFGDKLRLIIEGLLGGWFVPGSRSRPKALSWDERGFWQEGDDGSLIVREWTHVVAIRAFKLDLLTFDEIRFSFEFENDPPFEISEDQPGFERFIEAVESRFPQVRGWRDKVMQPPFARNDTLLYQVNVAGG